MSRKLLNIALLACARIGAVHSVVFAGFSAQSLADRINDAQAKVVITCDGANRGAKVIPLKSVVDQAAEGCTSLRTILVVAHCQIPVAMVQGRDLWLHDEIDRVKAMGNPEVEPEVMESEDLLFILYTSGSTGKPKGVMLSHANMLAAWRAVQTYLQLRPDDVIGLALPPSFSYGLYHVVMGLGLGATLVLENSAAFPARLLQRLAAAREAFEVAKAG